MALDFALIEASTQHALDKLESGEIIHPGLLCIHNFLEPELLLKLQNYISNDKLPWEFQEHHDGAGYRHDRKKINWVAESVIEETHMVLSEMTQYLNERFNRKNRFLGLSVWKDEKSFQVPVHVDNPIINISIQIYLNSNNQNLGTKFHVNDGVFQVPYRINCGYLMDNSYGIRHFYDGNPSMGYHRYSLYAIWSNNK